MAKSTLIEERGYSGADYALIEMNPEDFVVTTFYNPTPLVDTPYVGVNGGLFDEDTNELQDIHYTEGSSYNVTTNSFRTRTFVTYNGGADVAVVYADDMDEIKSSYSDVSAAIGGRDFDTMADPDGPLGYGRSRTFIGYKDGKVYAGVTQVSTDAVTATELENDVKYMGFDAADVVILDGGSSTKMQAIGNSGSRVVFGVAENNDINSAVVVDGDLV